MENKQNFKKIRIVLAEGQSLMRAGLGALIRRENDMEVVAEAKDGKEAVQAVKRVRPDVVLMDIDMPIMNGLTAARRILDSDGCTKKILLFGESESPEQISRILRVGSISYVLKNSSLDEFLQAIRIVSRGEIANSPVVAKVISELASGMANGKPSFLADPQLTFREAEVLQLIAEGYSNKEIGPMLEISVKTVEKHRQELMNKTGAHSTAAVTRYAISQGFAPRPASVVTG